MRTGRSLYTLRNTNERRLAVDSDRERVTKPRTEDLVVFLALSLPVFSVSAALLTFIIINAVSKH
jgi:hypothetical protein